jgi:hypothetical protein
MIPGLMIFVDTGPDTAYPDWDTAADACVSILRTDAGRDPQTRNSMTSS